MNMLIVGALAIRSRRREGRAGRALDGARRKDEL
jgi:hypothetical protein